jgi:putative ABC transport system permease protein
MSSWNLALRNLMRNRRRSLTTVLAMVIGGVTILLFGGYVQNIVCGLQTDFVRASGHLQLQHKDYYLYGSGDPSAYGIGDESHIIGVLEHDPVLAPMLLIATPTLEFGGIAGNFEASLSRTVYASGVIVADQNAMQRWNDYGFPGDPEVLALTGTSPDSAVIGVGVARVLRLCAPLHVSDCPPPSAETAAPTPDSSPGSTPDAARIAAASPPRSSGDPASRGAASGSAVASGSAASAALPADVALLAARDGVATDAGRSGADLDTGAATHLGAATDAASAADGVHIELLAATTGGAPNVARLRVAKAIDIGVKEANDNYVGMHLPAAQRLLYGRAPPKVTAIVLQLRHTSDIPAARRRIATLLATTLAAAPLAVYDFRELNPYYGQTVALFAAIFGFMAVLIGAIVLFTVGNTMNFAIVERTVEIGTLRAIGQRRAGIRRLFIAESLLLGTAGAGLGVLAALLLAVLVNHSGLTWTPPGRVSPIHLHVRVWGEWTLLASTASSLLAVAVISAWWPARRAARLQVVEALRHV